MASIMNIQGNEPIHDPNYRYRMPPLVAKKEGGGNGKRTVLVNLQAVAQALDRPSEEILRFLSVEMSCSSKTSKDGALELRGWPESFSCDLQQAIFKYIELFVLCPSCRNPETRYSIISGRDLSLDCAACGACEPVPEPQHKVAEKITAGRKEARKAEKKALKAERRAAKDNGKDTGQDADNGLEGKSKSKDGKSGKSGKSKDKKAKISKDPEVIPPRCPETLPNSTEAAAAATTTAPPVPGAAGTGAGTASEDADFSVFDESELDTLANELRRALLPVLTEAGSAAQASCKELVDRVWSLQCEGWSAASCIQLLCRVLFLLDGAGEPEPEISENVTHTKSNAAVSSSGVNAIRRAREQTATLQDFLDRGNNTEFMLRHLIGALEELCCTRLPGKVFIQVLKILYDEEVLPEKTIQAWARAGVTAQFSPPTIAVPQLKALRTTVDPFITWLDEAEEEDSEKEEEGE